MVRFLTILGFVRGLMAAMVTEDRKIKLQLQPRVTVAALYHNVLHAKSKLEENYPQVSKQQFLYRYLVKFHIY